MSTVSTIARTSDIHPEIPSPHWASVRYLEDEDRIVQDEHRYVDDGFTVEFSRMHSLEGGKVYQADDNIMIGWCSVWDDGSGIDNETFTVLLKDVPDLIAVLQRAYDGMKDTTRTLRRDPAVTDELMERDQ